MRITWATEVYASGGGLSPTPDCMEKYRFHKKSAGEVGAYLSWEARQEAGESVHKIFVAPPNLASF